MLLRFVAQSMRRSPRRKAMTVAAVAMGTAIATAMLGVMLDIGDKVNHELSSLGANILITPKGRALSVESAGVKATPAGPDAYLDEAQIPKIKSIFWQLNITGFMPSLTASARVGEADIPVRGVWFDKAYKTSDGRALHTGLRAVNPSWQVDGQWIVDSETVAECLPGAALSRRLGLRRGSEIRLFGQPFTVAGLLRTGGEEDDQLLLRLSDLQRLTGHAGQVDAVQVSALTKPDDAFARRDPATMNPKDLEIWNCTNYVRSITHQIEQALPNASAKPVWRVADSEGRVLSKISGLMLVIAIAALLASGLTVWSVMATTVLERRGEIAIMQATGATDRLIGTLFGAEVAVEGILGGSLGVLAGLQMAHWVGRVVFQTGIEIPSVLAPLAIFLAMLVAVAGAFPPLRRSLTMSPAVALRERL